MIAYAGLVAFFIDENWELRSIPLNLLPLEGDHSGARAAKLIYRDLRSRPGVLQKLCMCVIYLSLLVSTYHIHSGERG